MIATTWLSFANWVSDQFVNNNKKNNNIFFSIFLMVINEIQLWFTLSKWYVQDRNDNINVKKNLF